MIVVIDRPAMVATMARTGIMLNGRFIDWLEAQPLLDLVGSAKAASILGIPGPHVARLRKAGTLAGIPVEGTVHVYLRSEVEALAETRSRS